MPLHKKANQSSFRIEIPILPSYGSITSFKKSQTRLKRTCHAFCTLCLLVLMNNITLLRLITAHNCSMLTMQYFLSHFCHAKTSQIPSSISEVSLCRMILWGMTMTLSSLPPSLPPSFCSMYVIPKRALNAMPYHSQALTAGLLLATCYKTKKIGHWTLTKEEKWNKDTELAFLMSVT